MTTWTLRPSALSRVDLSRFDPFIPAQFKFFFLGHAGFAPYRLLAYLSTLISDAHLVEVGVHNGWGSLALSYNQSNTVTGYDIDLSTLSSEIRDNNPTLIVKEGLAHEMDPDAILAAPLIHFDAMHDGVYERVFYDFLVERGYRGLLILDDIHLNPAMRNFWGSIALPKVDLTKWGHNTGTGAVCFGDIQVVMAE